MKTRKQTYTKSSSCLTKRAEDSLMVAKQALDDKKGLDIKEVSLAAGSAYTDHLIIATGTSERHVQSLADTVVEYLHKAGHVVDSVEGTPNNQWVLVDAGDIVVHIFVAEMRELYNLEKLYSHDFDDGDDDDTITPDLTGS